VSQSAPIASPILLYDGTCGFCAESVQFILARDRKGTLRFAALDSGTGRAILERHPDVRGFDSVLFVEPADGANPERVLAHSTAALRVATYLGGSWRLLQLARFVPSPIRDAVYRLIARHRHRLSANGPVCVIPSARDRARFLD
jgi:predicted DCC family thiol-disulfide oxidoreductase YuxK